MCQCSAMNCCNQNWGKNFGWVVKCRGQNKKEKWFCLLRKVLSHSTSVVHRPSTAMVGRSANIDCSIVSKLLTSSSPIPSDVTFKVVDKENQEETTLEAHKMILALHSDHFTNAFYGSGSMFKEEHLLISLKFATTLNEIGKTNLGNFFLRPK